MLLNKKALRVTKTVIKNSDLFQKIKKKLLKINKQYNYKTIIKSKNEKILLYIMN
jgi:hypothetical protein